MILYQTYDHDKLTAFLKSQQLSDVWTKESVVIDSLDGDPCLKMPKAALVSKIRWVTLGAFYKMI
jgi:hypothetical protein